MIVQYEPCEVTNVELDINRTREVGKPLASTLWGSDHDKESYVKFETLDLSHPVFMTSMISGRPSVATENRQPRHGALQVLHKSGQKGFVRK